MQWFSGDIAAAIGQAKAKSAIFVVYCEGNDENSKQLSNLINDESVSSKLQSDNFVAIKIESDKPEYIQFCKIYQLVPVPSLFFIQNGIPIKVVTSVVKTKEELLEAIDNVIKIRTEASGSSSSTQSPVAEVKAPEPEIVCDGDKCYKKEATASSSNEENKPATTTQQPEETEEEKQEKIKRAMKLIEEKRIERVKEEQRLEKERELRRRQDGQQIQKLKSWQDEQEMAKLQEERRREKNEAAEARKRVLQQIEEDKKERARRFNANPTDEEPVKKVEVTPQATTPTQPPNSARIQFKKPDGETEIVTFDSDIPFGDLHAFVKSDILSGTTIKEFTLATAFPRREFSEVDFEKTLIDLNLAPTAVVLIIPGKKATTSPPTNPSSVLPTRTGGSIFDMFGTILMGIVTPVLAFFVYVKNLAFRSRGSGDDETGKRKRNEEIVTPNDAAKKRNMERYNSPLQPSTSSEQYGAIPKAGTYKRINPTSNIHRLHQDSDTDEEERKTYNGNSTQQM